MTCGQMERVQPGSTSAAALLAGNQLLSEFYAIGEVMSMAMGVEAMAGNLAWNLGGDLKPRIRYDATDAALAGSLEWR